MGGGKGHHFGNPVENWNLLYARKIWASRAKAMSMYSVHNSRDRNEFWGEVLASKNVLQLYFLYRQEMPICKIGDVLEGY